MSRVVINLGAGNLQSGCPEITAEIWRTQSKRFPDVKSQGSLPTAPELEQVNQRWQSFYREFYQEHARAIVIDDVGIEYFSADEFTALGNNLTSLLNEWLNSQAFQPIERTIRQEFNQDNEIEIILETNDEQLRRLPWAEWDLLKDFPQAEIALSSLDYKMVDSPLRPSNRKVKILAVFGNSEGLDLAKDRSAIAALPGAEPLFLESPSRRELDACLWDEQGWDILVFSGHSQTREGTGQISINPRESLTIEELKHALNKAVSQGLQLAIFNSCNGLGLARQLAGLYIPQVIVMRESVPNRVAQEFLSNFLNNFSSGKSLYLSVREARQQLQRREQNWEEYFPFATWLPVICSNPAVESFTWPTPQPPPPPQNQLSFLTALACSALVILVVVLVRFLGFLQAGELQAFDRFMQPRPDQGPDSRLAIVEVTESDLNLPEQRQRKGSISSLALTQLLENLQSHQPRAIGLDIYYDYENVSTALAQQFNNTENFFAICTNAVSPPRNLPPARSGYSDIIEDSDGVVRRHLISMEFEGDRCQADYALSTLLAFHYLAGEEVPIKWLSNSQLQIGDVVVEPLSTPATPQGNVIVDYLRSRRGAYQKADLWGYQTLLNYRSYHSLGEIAPVMTLEDVLSGDVDPELIQDRIVVIGTNYPGTNDFHETPYGEPISGVRLQAQMTSQILSATLDGRSLLTAWPLWAEILWIGSWSVVGSVVVWCSRKPPYLFLLTAGGLGGLFLICLVLFNYGVWVPLVPAALAFVGAAGCVLLAPALLRGRAGGTQQMTPGLTQDQGT